jgi:radical SAM protein with 4Fe4S-binding SPASM domain
MGFEISQLRLIELELFSFCNRTCNFCPNHYIDRISENKVLDIGTFKNLIQELKSNKYSGVISFSRYCEPFAFRDILESRIKYIRRHLPNIKLVCNTNGDYDWEGIDLDELTIMDYDIKLPKEELGVYNRKTKPYLVRKMRLGKINNRGGALEVRKKFVRDFPCYEPSYFVGIDYNGSVNPCCNIRSDVEIHKNYVSGNLKNNTLLEILNFESTNSFRNKVKSCQFDKICLSCSKTAGRYTSDTPSIMNPTS